MNSLGEECNELKNSYDACFNLWFSEKFLKGQQEESMCKPLFVVYQDCVRVSILNLKINVFFTNFSLFLQKAMKAQNIDLKEVDKKILGTDQEKEPVESKKSSK